MGAVWGLVGLISPFVLLWVFLAVYKLVKGRAFPPYMRFVRWSRRHGCNRAENQSCCFRRYTEDELPKTNGTSKPTRPPRPD